MHKKWFYRLLLSYLPIFLAITSLLWFISAMAMSEISKNASEKANDASAEHAMDLLDASLKSIDAAVLKELGKSGALAQFFYPPEEGTTFNTLYQPSNMLRSLMTGIQSIRIDSIYLYRQQDGAVLSADSLLPMDQSGDREFIQGLLGEPEGPAKIWSDVRSYQEFQGEGNSVEVVSLVRQVPVIGGGEGFIVVNIRTSAISQIIENVMGSEYTSIGLYDEKGAYLFKEHEQASSKAIFDDPKAAHVRSEYTGWELKSGIKYTGIFKLITGFAEILLIVGGMAIMLGIIGIVLVTRRNYNPIQSILMRIQHTSRGKMLDLLPQSGKDEFKFIENAVDNLMEQSIQYEERHRQDLVYRRQFFFEELIEGNRVIEEREWTEQMALLELPADCAAFQVIVLEVDHYGRFSAEYSKRDQYLLKFVLSSIVQELSSNGEANVWMEWLNARQMTVLYQYHQDPEMESDFVHVSRRWLDWVAGNLKFTVTVGAGGKVKSLASIPESYQQALIALRYKTVLGAGRMIAYEEVEGMSPGEIFSHLQTIRSLALKFRMGNAEWLDDFECLFQELRAMLLSREELENIGGHLIYHLQRETGELTADVRELWEDGAMNRLHECLEHFDTAEELYVQLRECLADTSERLKQLREGKRNHYQIRDIKFYMEQHYGNPDLSLTYLSDTFGMNPKYISQLFKEEYGVNFVDYLTQVRMEHAKQMLVDTDMPIKDIAVHSGYLHAFSFIRVFKKMMGLTPGDFRKNNR
ncbi:helix-turn-helix domain-containing protein [Paenibacillus dokdonensis]|uniref:Helix-turn-helix domain-containing protein n=1 Tax=Paenibacillus dokdonensis TaxID=2567944 RepID=A0ABU6GJT3_9BACL|nr:helix-turn-helix domain-containing protein [Paenibacillus dokdonensis]MEC0240005.1 helix-turn-helix domain-containing protein [Paenibacillus dokdonensis]